MGKIKFSAAKGHLKFLKLRMLYREAFPKCERKPFSIIRAMAQNGKTDRLYFEDEKGFVGMCATINGSDAILIDYLAVAKKRRGTGLGSEMIRLLTEHYKGYGVFLEIERLDENAKNNRDRIRRRDFYLRAGLVPMGTYVNLFGVDMELLGKNCHLTFDEYRSFYLTNYGKFAYDHIKPCEDQQS